MGKLITALLEGTPDDGDQGRQMRGMAIALTEKNIRPDKFGHIVPSQSGRGVYLVSSEPMPYCSCPDFENTGQPCKHYYAVQALLQGDSLDAEQPEPVGVRIAEPWRSYTNAQVHEGELFAELLRELCDTVEQPPQRMGRRRLPIGDMLYGMGLKVYSTLSTRRAMSGLRDAAASGRMDAEPSFNTPINYFGRPEMTPILRGLIQQSALPLRDVETCFAIDSSGFATTSYHRWFDEKWGGPGEKSKREVVWVKVHQMCGIQTNIVTVADATVGQSADSPYLPGFTRLTAENFDVLEVSGDMAYSSHKNLHAVADVGGTAYIPFKTGTNPVMKGKGMDPLWIQMYHEFSMNTAEFNRHYHKRSNVETVFHMVKAKFGDRIRAKTETAQINEALMKGLCHNICVLIRAMYALGITPVFDSTSCAEKALAQDVLNN